MKELIETILLSCEKSSYLIELIKHDSGIRYVRIEHVKGEEKSSININPSIISDLIEVLTNYKKKIEMNLTIVDSINNKLPKELRDKGELIQKRYLIGVPLKDLALQFDCEEKLIEMVLENKDIEIVSNKIQNNWNWKRKRRRKK
jgi:hypothetical protein